MSLQEYRRKRRFDGTPEPDADRRGAPARRPIFVVQLHHASSRHYDFRLEADGVLKSWAVPKGPSLRAGEKRLAVEVEDHPLSYAGFEGDIPSGHYGAGHVDVYDHGTWACDGDPLEAIAAGKLDFVLQPTDLAVLRRAHAAMRKRLDEAWTLRNPDNPLKTPQELLTLASIGLLFKPGLTEGIDFRGGTTIRTESSVPVDVGAYRDALSGVDAGDVSITEVFDPSFRDDQHVAMIRLSAREGEESVTPEVIAQVEAALFIVVGFFAQGGRQPLLQFSCGNAPWFGFAPHQLAEGKRAASPFQFGTPLIIQATAFVEDEEHFKAGLAEQYVGWFMVGGAEFIQAVADVQGLQQALADPALALPLARVGEKGVGLFGLMRQQAQVI